VEVLLDNVKATLMQAGPYPDAQAADMQRGREGFQKQRATRTQTAAVEPRTNAVDKEEEISQTQNNLSGLVSRIPAEVKTGAWSRTTAAKARPSTA
jgi:hypothetical protein